MREGGVAAELPAFENAVTFERLWHHDMGYSYREADVILHIGKDEERVYVAVPSGALIALSATDGAVLWRRRFEQRILAGVGVGSGQIAVADEEGIVHVLGASDGDIQWSWASGGQILARPVISFGTVLLRTAGGQLIALESSDGTLRWRVRRRVPELTLRGVGPPLVNDERVFAGFATGRLLALDLNSGREHWHVVVGRGLGSNEIKRLIDIDAMPTIAGDRLFVGAFQGKIVALNIGSGETLWSSRMSVLRDIVASNNSVYAVSDEGELAALSAIDGTVLWRQNGVQGRGITAPVILSQWLVSGDYKGYLHVFDAESGKVFGRARAGSGAILSLTPATSDYLYSLSESGRVSAFRLLRPE